MQEMSEGRRALIAVAISLLIVIVWSHFYKPPAPQQQQRTPAPITATAPREDENKIAPLAAPTPPAKTAPPLAAQAAEEKIVTVENSLYRVEFSNRGGVVRSWQLKKYFDDNKHVLDLVNTAAAKQLGEWPFSVLLSDPQMEARANSGLYVISPDDSELDAPTALTLHWSNGHLEVTKKLQFSDSYEVSAQVTASLDGNPLPVALAWRGGFGDTTVYQESQLVSVFYDESGKLNVLTYKKLGVSGDAQQPMLRPGGISYGGIEDQFFTAAFLPNGSSLNIWDWARQQNVTEDGKTSQEPVAEMAAGSSVAGPADMRVFVGPKDLKILGNERPPLEELVNFGWMSIIAKPLLWVLQWMYKYVPNYGWDIVLLTLAINTVLFPLKMSSWRSMQKMQRVGPEIRQIQDRYKKYSFNDPRKRKMNEEVMAVYNREGINPMGSCIPMVAQMPIWWALYRMLGGAIELRHAPWFGWVHDLSAHDPYYIIPIAMTITMYLMQKMTPTTVVDPTQQKMATYMPLMFGIFFFRLSAGLNLYIFTSNLVGMAQQYYLNRTNPVPVKGGGGGQKKLKTAKA
jgi:YidC/Oxa1 family membrane protein insertase